MKKLLFILSVFLLIPLVSLAKTPTGPVDGFWGVPWKTEFSSLEKERQLKAAGQEKDQEVYLSETATSANAAVFYLFTENQLTGGLIAFADAEIYNENIKELTKQLGKGQKARVENTQFWFYQTTLIIATTNGEYPLISFSYSPDFPQP